MIRHGARRALRAVGIPPAVRRLVHRRDHGRCCVPGCRNTRFLDLHHLVARALGGDHAPANLILLCDAHHRAVHEGRLRITGVAPDRLRFEHVDGRVYGAAPPTRVDPWTDAEKALRQLGFPAAVASAAVARARSPGGRDLDPAEAVRAALRECPRPVQ